MSELGDVLELLHTASTSFKSFVGEFVISEHPTVAHAALLEAVKRRSSRVRGAQSSRRSGSVVGLLGGSERDDEPHDSRVLVWSEPPDRYREQAGEGEETQLVIRDGERWWSYDPFMGATTNENDAEPAASTVDGQCEVLLRPSALLARLRINVTGRGERAGRAVIIVHGRSLDENGRLGAVTPAGVLGVGDECQLEVDAERGVILRLESHSSGRPLILAEALSVSFDGPVLAETFVFISPNGDQPAAELDHQPERLAIHEAVSRVPFDLFVLDPSQHSWTSFSMYSPACRRPPLPATITTTYISAENGTWVVLTQRAADPAPPTDVRPTRRIDTSGGPSVDVLETPAGTRVRTVIRGTQLELASDALNSQQLSELAQQVQPAPTAPPLI